MKKFRPLLYAPIIFVLVLAGILGWFYSMTKPVSDQKEFSNFLINKGASASLVGNKLQKSGFIRSALAFRVYLQFTNQSSKIQTGEFRLSPSLSMFEVIETLNKGPLEIWVTIPEGLRKEEIASRFATTLEKDESFSAEFIELSQNDEGMLFPDTYLFPKEVSVEAIVKKMTANFTAKTGGLKNTSDMSDNELLTLASLIERETRNDEERPVVAGIILKRLDSGWPLQIDAAVQYAIASSRFKGKTTTNWWPILTRDDLSINSPYNTYKFQGLPPGPIANPGISAIKAAYAPESSDYWYYIHDNSGNIHYATTLEEHNQNIAKYLGK